MKRLLLLLVMMQGGQLFCAAAGAAGAGAVSPEAKKIETVGKALQNFADALNAYKVSGNDDQVKVMQQVIADVRLLGSITPDELEKALRDAQLSRSAARAVSGAGAAAAGAVSGGAAGAGPGGVVLSGAAGMVQKIAIEFAPQERFPGVVPVRFEITPETTVRDVAKMLVKWLSENFEAGYYEVSFLELIGDANQQLLSKWGRPIPGIDAKTPVILNGYEKIMDAIKRYRPGESGLQYLRATMRDVH